MKRTPVLIVPASLGHIFYDRSAVGVKRFDLDVSPEACSLSGHHPVIADFDILR
ncbi:MAG: hypothetical protein J6T01_05750 [Kiritimatiellae bacterium]|nr:hypothetical protein [Kiritimatiellia bacterium]